MAFTTGNDINILQASDAAVFGAGAGNDKYILSAANVAPNQQITLSDTLGTNTLQLMGGLTIASSQIASNVVMLTLSNGAVVTVNGADTFSYEIAGDPLSGVAGTVQTYSAFVTTTLGAASVPTGTTVVDGTANKVIAGGTTGGTTTGQAFSLTTGVTGDALSLTAGNDTVTGASGTLAAGDLVLDTSTTDNDTMTAQVTSATLAPTIVKVENVNINGDFTTTGLDLTNSSGIKVLTFNSGIAGGTATATVVNAGKVAKIVAGTNVNTFNVTADTAATGTAGQVVIDTGSAATLALTAASTLDNISLITNDNLAVTTSTVAETLKITPTVANKTISLAAAAATQTIDIAGSVAAILKEDGTGVVSVKTITKSSTADLTVAVSNAAGGAVDLSKVDANKVAITAAMNNTLTVKNGVAVSATVEQTSLNITAPAATATTNAITFTNTAAVQTSLTATNIKTLTIASGAPQIAGVDATYATLAAGTNDVILTGTNDVKVTSGTAKSVDASGLVGALTYTQATDVTTTVKGGSGANTVTFINTVTAADVTYVGKDGGDTVSTLSTTANTSITTGAGADAITANGVISGVGVLVVNSGAGNDTLSATGLTTGTLSANLGAGNDTVTFGANIGAGVIAIDGGDGTDKIVFTATAATVKDSNLTLTNVETLQIKDGTTVTFSSAQLSGKAYNVMSDTGAGTAIIVATGVASTSVTDLSTLVIDRTLANNLSKVTINDVASTVAVNITGTVVADTITAGTVGSTITGGAGQDALTLNNGGVDKVMYTAATGAALLVEAGGTATQAATALPTDTGDTIGIFATGTDKIVLSLAFGTQAASAGLVVSGGTSYTAASTGLASADFIKGAFSGGAGATGVMTADATNGGRFYFDTASNKLYYDAQGNTTADGAGAAIAYAGAADDFLVATVTGVSLVSTDFAFV